jgi:hypothetical protein
MFGYRETSGAGNITAPFFDIRQADSGAGTITGDWVAFQHEGMEEFSIEKGGTVNIKTGATYNINGSPHTHAGGTTDSYSNLFMVMGG